MYGLLLIILVTGNRKMEVAALRPRLYCRVLPVTPPPNHRPVCSEGKIQSGWRDLSSLFPDSLSAGTRGRDAEPCQLPSRGAGDEARADTAWSSPCGEVSVLGASSSCAFCPSSCWHTWGRTTAFLLVVQPLLPHRASGTSRHSHHSRSSDSHRQVCYTQGRSRSYCPTHLGSRRC